MRWCLVLMAERPRVAIFVSQYLHCLVDLLHRQQTGELNCAIPLIVSNHTAAAPLAQFYGAEFRHVPVNAEEKAAAEAEQLRLLRNAESDVVVLARYMQILSTEFVAQYPERIINVHHSFLPAFMGAKPYHAAFARGGHPFCCSLGSIENHLHGGAYKKSPGTRHFCDLPYFERPELAPFLDCRRRSG